MNIVTVPQLAWGDTKGLKLPLPDSWQVEVFNMAGYNRPAMKPDQIKASVSNPIGIAPIRELARGKKEIVILFDDTTRVTRTAKIVPFVLEELAAAGIPDSRIRFIVALGLHGALDRLDFIKKLGEEVVARFPIYNHNPFAKCTYVGTTATYQTRVYVNEVVMGCDFKITIGSVAPHSWNGFSGGGKIILPGVVSFETTQWNHQMAGKTAAEHRDNPITGMGIYDENPPRADINQAAELAGVDVSIHCILNMWGETVSVHTGAMKPAYAAAVEEAKTHYLTPRAEGKDIVIANIFNNVKVRNVGLRIAYPAVSTEGGDIVLIANSPEGSVTHYLGGTFGKILQAKDHRRAEIPQHINRFIDYTEYPDPVGRGYLEGSDKVLFINNWDDVLQVLQKYHGAGTKVAVYPNADIQYCL